MNDVVVRPVLDGAREVAGVFDGFVRSGAVIETKAFTGVTGDAGGFAIPKEIDAVIDATLTSASPIRGIASVVQVGSAGYRKLVTTGGTPSGWAAADGRGSRIQWPNNDFNPDFNPDFNFCVTAPRTCCCPPRGRSAPAAPRWPAPPPPPAPPRVRAHCRFALQYKLHRLGPNC